MIDEAGVRHVSRSYDRRSITASGGISLAVMLDDVGVAASSLVDVSVVSDGKFCDVEAVISDVAEGAVGADAVAPLA